MVVATAVPGVLTVLLLSLYIWRNRTRRAAPDDVDEKSLYDELDEKTDFEIAEFRYVY